MTLNNRMLPAAMLALALMGPHAGSQASTLSTQPASACKPYGWSKSFNVATNGPSIYIVYANAPVGVVCPVTRVGPGTNGGLRVWIDGEAPLGSEVSCSLWSFDYNGLLLASQSFNVTGGSDAPFDTYLFDRYLELAPAAVPTYSSQVVTCALPNNSALYDIEPISL